MKKYSDDLLRVAEDEGYDCVEDYIESSQERDTEYIASLVEQGCRSGYYPTWSISIQADDEDVESCYREVARLIRNGYTCGFYPTFNLTVKKYSWEDYQ